MAATVLRGGGLGGLAGGDVDEIGAGLAQGGGVLDGVRAVGEPDGERPVPGGAHGLDDRPREANLVLAIDIDDGGSRAATGTSRAGSPGRG